MAKPGKRRLNQIIGLKGKTLNSRVDTNVKRRNGTSIQRVAFSNSSRLAISDLVAESETCCVAFTVKGLRNWEGTLEIFVVRPCLTTNRTP